jgi:ferredoxin
MSKCFRCGSECGDNLYCTSCTQMVKDKLKESVKDNKDKKDKKKGWF